MKTTKLIVVMAMLCLADRLPAQIKPIKIGEKVPDIEFTDIINYPGGKAKLSDFKGKLVILDFWSRDCGPCIAAMPKMDSLQKFFGDKIRILPVIGLIDMKFKSSIDTFWRSNEYTSRTSLPNVVDTGILNKYFPKQGVPYEVWIDQNGILRALTFDEYVNKKEITAMLNGVYPDWEDVQNKKEFDPEQSLILSNSRINNVKTDYSAFSRYLPGISYGINLQVNKEKFSITGSFINAPITHLYTKALNGKAYLNRFVIETADSSRFFKNTYTNEWVRRNSYCYELSLSRLDKDVFYDRMLKDLNYYLKLNGRFEHRNVPCLVLKCIDKNKSPHSIKTFQNNASRGIAYSLNEVIKGLSYFQIVYGRPGMPVIDETGIKDKENKNIKLSVDLENNYKIEILNQELSRYGLVLEKASRKQEMFVISEIK